MEKELTRKLVDLAYGTGSYSNPKSLLTNPAEEDEHKWDRRNPSAKLTTKQFTPQELDAIVNYCAEQRAQWRVSNERAKLSADIRAENARKSREAEDLLITVMVEKVGAAEVLATGVGRTRVINAFQRQGKPQPKGL